MSAVTVVKKQDEHRMQYLYRWECPDCPKRGMWVSNLTLASQGATNHEKRCRERVG